jgi:K+-sensing histidine kinase KdpD
MEEIGENGDNVSSEKTAEDSPKKRKSKAEKIILFGRVLHEIEDLLAIMQRNSNSPKSLASKLKESERAEYFRLTETAAFQMKNIAESMLVFGKIHVAQSPSERAKLDITMLCKNIVADICSGPEKRKIIISISKFVPECIHVDGVLVRCVLSNLLISAMRYSEEGTAITLRLRCQGGNLIIYVQGRGIGIPAEDMANIFRAFRCGEKNTDSCEKNTGKYEGISLGMFMIKFCIAVLGGSVCVNFNEKIGTTFKATIPYSLESPK